MEQSYQRGRKLAQQQRWVEAADCFLQTLDIAGASHTRSFALWLELAQAQRKQGLFEQAAQSAEQACGIQPESELALRVWADCLQQSARPAQAAAVLRRLAPAQAQQPDLLLQTAETLLQAEQYAQAANQYMAALLAEPEHIQARLGLAAALFQMKQPEGAYESCRIAAQLAEDDAQLWASTVHYALHAAAWKTLDEDLQALHRAIAQPETTQPTPWAHLSLPGASAEEHRRSAAQCAQRLTQSITPLPALQPATRKPGRIRIGYFGNSFYEHAGGRLIAEVLELHDRSSFEVFAYSYSPDDGSALRARHRAAVEHFIDVAALDLRAIAERIRTDVIDILIDLRGYQAGTRFGVFGYRAAPIQVSYLGFAGTLGSPLIDYLITDTIVTPPQAAAHYDEKFAYLPHCYQANDRQRPIGPPVPRSEAGLPLTGFVFACFNNTHKITPALFALWCRLLARVPDSVLWLMETSTQAKQNLAREARMRGIDPQRLIFAPALRIDQHLARLQHADLVLDTLPYNAHVTGSDALWAGVPMLSCCGHSFAARVGASLLQAADLPELITHSLDEYEARALQLALQPAELQALRARLAQQRLQCPLFDSPQYTRALESLYAQMLRRWQQGEAPDHIAAQPHTAALTAAVQAARGVLAPAPLQFSSRRESAVAAETAPAVHKNSAVAAAVQRAAQLHDSGQFAQAAAAAEEALQSDPDNRLARRILADALRHQGRATQAAQVLQPLVNGTSNDPAALVQAAHAMLDAGDAEQALQQFMAAVLRKADHVPAHLGMAAAFERLGLPAGAAQCYRTAAKLAPDDGLLWAAAIHQAMHACAWDGLEADTEALQRALERNPESRPSPFVHLALPGATAAQHRASSERAAMAAQQTLHFALPPPPARRAPGRIRLGYLSYDFRAHPMSRVIGEVFELHDRSRFELFLYSIGPDDGSPERARIMRSAEHWIDLHESSDRALAERIRADGIDILVDLMGHTRGGRLAVLASRPAPVQVNFLGYPGTSGCAAIDYILVDSVVAPPGSAQELNEHCAYLPHSYFPCDRKQPVLPKPARSACGLPERGFVFCCFNNHYKITPDVFALWCRLLAQVPGSVLWLLEANEQSRDNLVAFAQQRGVDAARLIFAPGMPPAQHLARIGQADLVLDTQPYNAHTTGLDALRAGVPLITCVGNSFAARVGASLLQAAGLPELVCHSLADYEALALQLAQDPQRHAALRRKLAAQLAHAPLFDTPRYVSALEKLYLQMFERRQQGEEPASLKTV